MPLSLFSKLSELKSAPDVAETLTHLVASFQVAVRRCRPESDTSGCRLLRAFSGAIVRAGFQRRAATGKAPFLPIDAPAGEAVPAQCVRVGPTARTTRPRGTLRIRHGLRTAPGRQSHSKRDCSAVKEEARSGCRSIMAARSFIIAALKECESNLSSFI